MPTPESSQAGTYGSIVLMPWPWPPRQQILFARVAIPSGDMHLTTNPDGTLTFALEGQSPASFTSCPIVVPCEFCAAFIAVSWNLPSINMIVETTIVISTDAPDAVPSQCVISGRIPNDLRDFSKESEEAVKRRRGTSQGTHPIPNRRRKTDKETFNDLQNEANQIRDLIQSIDEGKLYHLAGMSVRLRALIADNKYTSLLQTCAAILDAPLTVYVPPIVCSNNRSIPESGTLTLAFAIDIKPSGVARNPADLDVWLASDAARINGKISSHKELLQSIGNTIGSHVVRDAHPSVDALRQLSFGVDGHDLDSIAHYLKTVAAVGRQLSLSLLERAALGKTRG